jgi:hypothetical protein
MKRLVCLLLMLITIGILSAEPIAAFRFFRNAKVTLHAVDDSGQLVSGAKVGVGFDGPGGKYSGENGVTGEDGSFSASGACLGKIQYSAKKTGYYSSHYHYNFKSMGVFRWEPWNPRLNVLLRKIENPVPMYARKPVRSIEIPVTDSDVGFDLLEFDWVSPYGKGVIADFIFRLERQGNKNSDFDATLTVRFSNKFDGIQLYRESRNDGNEFYLPRFAPEGEYQKQLILREWRTTEERRVNRNFDFLAGDINYIFRVRSEEENNKLKKAMYGKILGSISFDTIFSKIGTIHFSYHLNPDYTRNLEFDTKRNLFGNLPPLEQVTDP